MNIYEEIAAMAVRAKGYNREKELIGGTTIIGIIKNVNEEKMLVDVYLYQNGSTIRNVIIGTNTLGLNNQLKLLPSVNQKGVVIVSNQHPPILIATIPNGIDNYSNDVLEDGFVIGNNDTYIKKYSDEELSIKAGSTSVSLHENKLIYTTIEASKEYRKTKEEIQAYNLGDEILSTNTKLLMKASDLLDRLDTFFNLSYNGVRSYSEELDNLKKDINSFNSEE